MSIWDTEVITGLKRQTGKPTFIAKDRGKPTKKKRLNNEISHSYKKQSKGRKEHKVIIGRDR
jgi:hypothetical protein